eukprot:6257116-Prymnesium_polylepis.1
MHRVRRERFRLALGSWARSGGSESLLRSSRCRAPVPACLNYDHGHTVLRRDRVSCRLSAVWLRSCILRSTTKVNEHVLVHTIQGWGDRCTRFR